MRAVLSEKRWIAVFLAIIVCLTAMGFAPNAYGLSEKTNTLSGLKPTGELGFLITGKDVHGTKGFQKDIVYLTQEQMERLKLEKDPSIYGLGDSWRENQRYSSYDNHGTGTYHYTIADGLDINTVLDSVVTGGSSSVDRYWIWSSGSYLNKIIRKTTEELKYYAPGDQKGTLSAAPMLALYKTTTTATNQNSGTEPEGSPQRLAVGGNVFIFGQSDITEDNNCHFIKETNALYVQDPVTLIQSDNGQDKMKRLKDFMNLGIYQTSYSFKEGATPITHNVEGVPMQYVLQDMKLSQYLSDYAENRVELVSEDGTKKQIAREDISKCFLTWGFTDDTVTPKSQTGQLAVYMPGTTPENSIAYNLSKVNVVDSKGKIVTAIPKKPSPAAPTSFKAAKKSYNSIKLTWKKAESVSGYNLYRYNTKTRSWQKLKKLSAGSVSYTNTGLATNTTYKYKLRSYTTVNGRNYEGAFSKEASAKPVLNKTSVTKLSKSGKTAVKVKWKKVTGANGYQIYRSTKKTKSYKKVATIKKGSTVAFTNKKLKKGRSYYYKVRPYRTVNGRAQYGSFSAAKRIKR